MVEMQMMNVEQTQLKAIMWTRFVPVNVKTGKRESHPSDFMEFARSIELENNFSDLTIRERILMLLK